MFSWISSCWKLFFNALNCDVPSTLFSLIVYNLFISVLFIFLSCVFVCSCPENCPYSHGKCQSYQQFLFKQFSLFLAQQVIPVQNEAGDLSRLQARTYMYVPPMVCLSMYQVIMAPGNMAIMYYVPVANSIVL